MIQVPERLMYSFLATMSISLAILFKKQLLLTGKPPVELMIQFIAISAILLTVNLFLFQKQSAKKIKKINQSEKKYFLMAGIFLLVSYFLTTFGLQFTTSINYSFITRSTLIFTTILAFFLLKERMHREKLLLVFCFFAGIYLVTTGGRRMTPQIGDLIILTGAFFFSYFSIIQKILNKNLPPEIISWGVTCISAILAIVYGLFIHINLIPLEDSVFVFLVGLTEAIVILFMNKALRVTDVTYYIMMNMFVPVINAFLGFFFLHEMLNLIQLSGGMILMISGILVQRLRS